MANKPARSSLPSTDVQRFRLRLRDFLRATDDQGRVWGDARWGVYAFYDYDGEPIYVGQTNEQLRVRIQRHLTNQRSDAVAMRILDVFEVADIEVWPLWNFQAIGSDAAPAVRKDARRQLDALEYSVYLLAIHNSKFKAILNEKIPPISPLIELPPSLRGSLIDEETRSDRGHPDVRIERRAETLARLASVARERGEVSEGLRRVLVIQAARLAYSAAQRLAYAEGRSAPFSSAIDVPRLVGTTEYEFSAYTPTEAARAMEEGRLFD